KIEERRAIAYQLLGGIEDLGVKAKHRRQVYGERAIHIDRNLGYRICFPEPVERVDELLGPPQGKRGDQYLATPRGYPPDHLTQPLFGIGDGLVGPVGIGRFDDEGVDRTL